MAITTDALRAYVLKRQEAKAANGTINRELSLLRRAFGLAVEDGKLRHAPHFPMLKEAPPRKGFLAHEGYRKMRDELPEYLRPILAMGYYTGMRLGEILGLTWENLDLREKEIRLDPGTTKNDEPRTVPLYGELLELLLIERERNPNGERVFSRAGERIGSFYKAWKSAAKRAKLEGLLFHDLRRTGVRSLRRAGVSEHVPCGSAGTRRVPCSSVTTSPRSATSRTPRKNSKPTTPRMATIRRQFPPHSNRPLRRLAPTDCPSRR
jgi:integrase